jgi:hypothetical protein
LKHITFIPSPYNICKYLTGNLIQEIRFKNKEQTGQKQKKGPRGTKSKKSDTQRREAEVVTEILPHGYTYYYTFRDTVTTGF